MTLTNNLIKLNMEILKPDDQITARMMLINYINSIIQKTPSDQGGDSCRYVEIND